MQLSIVIPCLNERKTIAQVVKQAHLASKKAKIKSEIIVADNGSTDGSLQLLQRQRIARIVKVPIRGYGAALHWGILRAKGKFVLYADADLSYSFHQLKRFLRFLEKKNSRDLVLGSRFLGKIAKGAMPFHHRYLGTPVLTFLIRLIYHLPTTDCNSGMRLIRKKFYQTLNMKNAGMEWASELLIKTALVGGSYSEVPITLYPDKRGRKPHLASWQDGWRHLKAIILLRPNLLFILTLSLFTLGIASSLTHRNVSILFFIFGTTFFFCTLAAKLIKFALDGKPSLICRLLLRLPLVQCVFIFAFIGILQFLFFSDELLVAKILILHAILVYCMWVFFIETIKTHLLNTLPANLMNYK